MAAEVKASEAILDPHAVPTRPLGHCGQVLGGGTPSKNNAEFWAGTIPWVSAKEMWTGEIRGSRLRITEQAMKASPAKLIPANSVLFVVRGSILFKRVPVAVNRVVCTINQDMKAIVPGDDILADYLALMMRATNDELKSRVSTAGNSTGKLETNKWSSVNIPVPPLPEQQRLVARIEGLTNRFEQARDLRQQLTEEVEDLLRALVFKDEDAKPTKMRNLLRLRSTDVAVQKNETYQFAGVYSFGRGVFKSVAKPGHDFAYSRLTRAKAGEFTYPKLMAWEGALGMVPPECDGCFVSPEFPVFEVDTDRVFPEVLDVYFRTPSVWPKLAGLSTGTNVRRRRLNPQAFLDYEMALPSRATQLKVRAAYAKQTELRRLQKETEAELAAFTPALLAKAFRGEL
jgi:hypothetical protein